MVKSKENLFEYLGRRQKENKKMRKMESESYWKLPAAERIHFDSKVKDIEKNYGYSGFHLTFFMVKASFFFLVLMVIIKILFNVVAFSVDFLNNSFSVILNLLILSLIIDFFFILISSFLVPSKVSKLKEIFGIVK